MTEERRQKLLQSSQGPGAEPFSQYNHMKVTAVDDGTATVELELQPDSLNCWGLSAAPGTGKLTAVGTVEKTGGHMGFSRTDIRDEGGKLIAALRTVMYLTGRPLEL